MDFRSGLKFPQVHRQSYVTPTPATTVLVKEFFDQPTGDSTPPTITLMLQGTPS